MKKIIILTLSLIAFSACKKETNTQQEEYQKQMDYVIGVHDEVMPKMGKLSELIATLEYKMATSDNSDASREALKDLQEAHDFMMEWMRDFAEKFPNALKEPDFSKEEYSAKLKTLEAEEEEVIEMKNKVNESIARAEKLIAEEK